MILLLLLNKLSPSQVIFFCNKQSDCYIGAYCDASSECYDCSYIMPTYCDALNTDCCSKEFLVQCVNNPYQCPIDNKIPYSIKKMDDKLFMFLLIFTMGSMSYLSIGSYRNKYINQKTGVEILPNINFWKNIYGLVKDGCFFSFSKCKECFSYKLYNKILP